MLQPRLPVRRVVELLGLAAIPLLLLLVNQMLVREFEQNRVLMEDVARSYQTRAQLQTVLSLYQDMETGQRGFVLTGDPVFLAPYARARARVDRELARLDMLDHDTVAVQRQIPALLALSSQKLVFMERTIGLRRDGRADRARQIIAAGDGRVIMDALREQIARIDGAENTALAARAAAADAAHVRTQRMTFAMQTMLALLLLATTWLVMRSMAQKRRAAESYRDLSARQAAIFDSAKDGMMILDEQGVIQSANPAAARMYGREADEMIGRSVGMLFETPPSDDEIAGFLKRLQARRTGDFGRIQEFSGRRQDGSVFPSDVAVSPVRLAAGVSYLAIVRDITGRKQVEQMKTEFVSTVSHELRTPLTSIAGSLGLLRAGTAGELSDRAARLIGIAHDNSQRLIRLINDILDIEKMESGKIAFDLKRVHLKPLLERAVDGMRGFAAGLNVWIELHPVPEDAVVMVDEDRLVQVVTNLLSNAAKFSPPGEMVDIAVISRPHGFRITVADKGPGIPEAFRDRIFGKFAQADSSDTRQKGGTGLGLSIAREIVIRLGGTIGFESIPGTGTAFHVDLPAADQRIASDRRASSGPDAQGAPRILHVDDDSDTLRLVASAFEGKAELLATPSVQEARAALARDRFDAAILDIVMPDGSGLDLLPLLQHGEQRIPAIIFTARDSNPALAASVDAVLTKSRVSLDELVDATMRAIAEAGEEEA